MYWLHYWFPCIFRKEVTHFILLSFLPKECAGSLSCKHHFADFQLIPSDIKKLKRRSLWSLCKKLHRSQYRSNSTFKESFVISNIRGKKLSSSFISGCTISHCQIIVWSFKFPSKKKRFCRAKRKLSCVMCNVYIYSTYHIYIYHVCNKVTSLHALT